MIGALTNSQTKFCNKNNIAKTLTGPGGADFSARINRVIVVSVHLIQNTQTEKNDLNELVEFCETAEIAFIHLANEIERLPSVRNQFRMA